MAYREEDVDARLKRIEERLGKIESNERTATWTEALRAWRVPEAIGIALLLGAIFYMAAYARDCTHHEDLDREARADRLAATPPPESPEVVGCRELCASMGLNGGVLMEFDGTWHGTGGTFAGTFDVRRDGHSCMCGNGMGGAVRVDPDGRQTNEIEHPGPARSGT
jgi:hypothetical protein